MSRRIIIASVVTGVIVVGAAAGGFAFVRHGEQIRLDKDSRAAADRFAAGWSQRDVLKTGYAGRTADQVAASFKTATAGLGSGPVKVTVTSFTRDGDRATGKLSVAWTVAEGSIWAYTMPISLQRNDVELWDVVARDGATMWAPDVDAKAKLVAARTWGKRGEVLGRDGSPILAVGKVYDVAIDPARASAETVAALAKVVDEPADNLVAKYNKAKASGSKAPIPVIAYRETDFQARKAALDALVGVIYPPRVQPLAPSSTFARPLLGSYGPATAETIKNGKGRYVAGDYAGLSGLQGQYDAALGGTPGVQVTASDKPDAPLFEKAAVDGAPMTLTLDAKTQSAAEAALAGSGTVPSALVAVDVATGDLLAVANSPSFGMNRALLSSYAPGSTLKVATTYSLLTNGLSPSKPVLCPPTVVVDGLTMRNYEHETLGLVPFSVDFAHSCNTAFVGLAATMGDADVHDAALALGVGAGWDKHLGIAGTFDGSVPVATSKTEKAATAFGQAKTSVSPASLAVMVASVARGSYIEPALISAPAVAGADRTPKPLDAKAIGQLQSLMRLVVTNGTASGVMKSVIGGPVYGKTGTAEYGSDNPPATHAWFVGWQGPVAFAVLVEQGKSGATDAAPIAKAFLETLHR
ncbi:MAG TPA: penicillin-binding transpeptidase domain-containing protein [Dermatophilaceae bacterium]|nr:penicillin-binding transpeptidase domain-containing protein [Dermatophilaceae bacterium]